MISFGLETLDKVNEAAPGTAIIVNTSLDDEATAREALKQGAQDYLVKGEISPGLLARSIRYAMARKRAEEALRRSEEKYRDLFENARDIVFTLDLDRNITSINNAVERIAGYVPGELVGNSITRYLSPEAVSLTNDKFQLNLRGEQAESPFELEIRTKGGRRITLEVSSRPVYENGAITAVTGLARDITDRKEGEKTLQAERDRLDIIIENSPEAKMVLLDRDFNFIMVSEAYARSCRRPRDFFPGKNHFDLYPHEENEAIFRQVVESGNAVNFKEKPFEFPEMPGRGVTYWDWTLTPVKDAAGRVQTLVFSLVDVTDKVSARKFSEALNEINVMLASSLNFRQKINQAMNLAEITLGSDCWVVVLRDSESPFVYSNGFDDSAPAFAEDENLIRSLVHDTDKIVVMPDVSHDNRVDQSLFEKLGLRALLDAPLGVKGHIFGSLTFGYRTGPVEFIDAQSDFLEKLAASLSMAIENSRLYQNEQELRASIQRYASQLAMVHRISLFLNREIDKRKLLDSVLSAVAGLTGAGLGTLVLTGKESESAKLVSTYYAPWFKERCDEDPKIEDFHKQVSGLLGKNKAGALRAGGLLSSCLKFVPEALSPGGLLIGVLRDTKGKKRGYFVLGQKAHADSFSGGDEEIASLLASQASVALISLENFEREHEVASTLQDAMLPEMPDRDDINFGFYYRSASGVSRLGGDFYDLIDLPDGRLAVLVGDVCGQGLEAATSTAMMKYTVRAYLQADPDPSLCLTRLNQAVMNQLSLDKFVTLSLAVIDPARQQADYASAGHPPALLVRSPKASLVELGRTIPIGVVDNYNYTNKSISLSGACSLALYTDGLIEARPPGGDPFGHERLLAAASSRSCLAPQQLVKALSHRVDVYSQSNLNDDICLLVVQLPPART